MGVLLLLLLLLPAMVHFVPSVATLSCQDHRGQNGDFRMLQPDNMDRIMHGAGQDAASFREYWNFMPNDT
eukprot:SAG31_NODE_36016_length_317_cov_0.940367_1_plen_69_part_10